MNTSVQAAYDRMDRETEAFKRGEEVAEDARLSPSTFADFEVDPMQAVADVQGYDPRKEKQTMQHDPKPAPAPFTAERILENWYLFLTGGRLQHAGMKPGEGMAGGADELEICALYVEDVPMFWERNMKPILFHKLDGKPWQFWYGPETRSMAAALFEGFKQALKDQMEAKPFAVYAENKAAPDHLEQADAANEAFATERNKEWRKRAA